MSAEEAKGLLVDVLRRSGRSQRRNAMTDKVDHLTITHVVYWDEGNVHLVRKVRRGANVVTPDCPAAWLYWRPHWSSDSHPGGAWRVVPAPPGDNGEKFSQGDLRWCLLRWEFGGNFATDDGVLFPGATKVDAVKVHDYDKRAESR